MTDWRLVGIASVTASSDEVTVGTCAGSATAGRVPFLVQTLVPADAQPLGFGLLGLIDGDNIRSWPTERYYPKREASVIQLGPGITPSFSGKVVFRPRSYNTRWLRSGVPSHVWTLLVSVAGEDVSTEPRYTPNSFTLYGDELVRSGDAGSVDEPRPLRYRNE